MFENILDSISIEGFDVKYFFSTIEFLLPAIPITFLITIVSFVCGGALGFLLALIRIYKVPFLSPLATLYISFFRGTPLLVQLVMFYYGIPILLKSLGLNPDFINSIDAIYYSIVIFSLYASSYLSEITRGALLSVDRGQTEAAFSIGMSYTQALRRIILPQAFMITLPNLLNFFIMQLKNTSLVSVITIQDLMGVADTQAASSSKFLEVYFMAALLYWAICVVLEFIFSRIEKRLESFRKSHT